MKKSRFVAFAALLMALLLLVCSCGNSASTTPKASGTQSGSSETETVRTDFESNEEHLSYVLNRGNISGGLGGVYDAVLAALKGTGSATAEKVHGKGQSTLEISEELQIKMGTVKAHVHNIFTKLNISRRSKLMKRFLDYGPEEEASEPAPADQP